MEAIEEYLRSHQCVIRATLTYIMRMTIIVEIYGDFPSYATSDDEMMARMLHFSPEKNKLLLEKDAQTF